MINNILNLNIIRFNEINFIQITDKVLAITKSNDYLENSEIQTKVEEYERQIDQMVYKLYCLSPKEVKIVGAK